jgi:molybdopterin-guanine dinucleotide biosynthesis protein MobB
MTGFIDSNPERGAKSIPVVSVVGKKKAGKTTLVVALVEEFTARGYRIGTVKHDAHTFEIDHEGKDSYKHFHAGAVTTLILSDERLAMVKRCAVPLSVMDLFERYFDPETDLIITEGFKRSPLPKVEIYRHKPGDEGLLCVKPEDNLIAVVSDEAVATDRPIFATAALKELVDFLIAHFGL